MVEPASSSLKRLPLSTAWLLRRSRQPVLCKQQSYLLHHLNTGRERLLSSSEQVRVDPLQDGDRPPAHHLSAAKKHSRPSATAAATTKEAKVRALQQLRATSEDHKVHSVEKSPRQLQDARRLRRKNPRSRRPRHKQGGNY